MHPDYYLGNGGLSVERLTHKTPNVPAVPVNFTLDFVFDLDNDTWHGLSAIFERLAEYEGTGYNPVDFDKLCREMSDLRMALGLDTYDDLRKIIQDDRLLVLPCPIGSTVYIHKPACWENGRATFEGCEFSRDCTHWRGFKCPLKVGEATFNATMYKRVGQTYWLTPEEAEAAIPADQRARP